MFTRASLLVALAILSLTVGCSRSKDVPRYDVQGRLTYNRQPMNFANIVFRPVINANEKTLGILAKANANGEYALRGKGGLPAGEYVVTLEWPGYRPGAENDPAPAEEDIYPDQLRGAYVDSKSSTLRATVREQINQIDFALPVQ